MPPSELVTIILAAVAAIVWLVRLEGRVNEAHRRCDELKATLKNLEDLDVRTARIETRIDGILEQFKDLNASIRWMRQPGPDYDQLHRPKGG